MQTNDQSNLAQSLLVLASANLITLAATTSAEASSSQPPNAAQNSPALEKQGLCTSSELQASCPVLIGSDLLSQKLVTPMPCIEAITRLLLPHGRQSGDITRCAPTRDDFRVPPTDRPLITIAKAIAARRLAHVCTGFWVLDASPAHENVRYAPISNESTQSQLRCTSTRFAARFLYSID